MNFRAILFGLALLFSSTAAFAQETGTISGAVLDTGGRVVAGAAVRLSSDVMPAARNTVTSESGLYAFLQLLPGTYTIEIDKTGVGKVSRTAVVSVGRDTQVDVILGAQVTESVTVSAIQPRVDLRSSEVSFNYRREFIQDLPLERSYLGLLQIIPGIADNGGFAPNGGGSRQDNVYLIDGVNITNPLFGYLGTEINELDIAEVNAKRGAISAAAGRAQGFVSNVVTKSGTNRFTGAYRFEAIPSSWIADSDKQVKSTNDRYINAASFGGPIAQNRLFFYGSTRIFRSESTRAANVFGPLPKRKERVDEFFGKLTASITNNLSLNFGYRHRPTTIDFAGIGTTDAPSVGTNTEGTNRVVSATADWFIGSRTTATVKYVRMDEQSEAVAVTDLGFQPAFDVNNLAAMGRWTTGGVSIGGAALRLNRQNYYRDEVKADVTNFLDFGGMRHQVKVGFGWDQGVEDLTRNSNGWGDISTVTVSGQSRIRTTYYPEQPTQLSKGRSYSFYVQDDVTLTPRLVVNAGLLMNRDELIQDLGNINTGTNIETGTFLTFGFADQLQPRLGFNYQVRRGVGDKIYGNYGRYFGLEQKSGARSMASGRLYTENTDFNPVTGAFIATTIQANTAAKVIIRPMKSPHTDEFLMGYATPLADGWSFDAFWMYRDTDDFVEDIPSVLPFSSFVYRNDPIADRKFKTFTMELSRNMRDNWAMNVSYAWSKLYGNYDQDYSGGLAGAAVFNTSSLLNDGPGTFTADTNRQGVLSQDRPHVFKVLATYTPPQIENLALGVSVRTQSGTPWSALGLSRGSGVTYLNYLEPAGTNRNPTWTNADLLVKYGIKMGSRRAIRLEARVLNLFNNETTLLVDQRKFLDARNLTFATPSDPACLSCWTDTWTAAQTQNSPNPNFGKALNFAGPRRLLMSVLFDF
jgi:hypothetical protein